VAHGSFLFGASNNLNVSERAMSGGVDARRSPTSRRLFSHWCPVCSYIEDLHRPHPWNPTSLQPAEKLEQSHKLHAPFLAGSCVYRDFRPKAPTTTHLIAPYNASPPRCHHWVRNVPQDIPRSIPRRAPLSLHPRRHRPTNALLFQLRPKRLPSSHPLDLSHGHARRLHH